MFDPLELHGIVLERHRVAILKQGADESVDLRIALRPHEVFAALRRFADLVLYELEDDPARTFSHPRYVIKGGDVVIEDGDIRETPQGREFLVKPACDPGIDEFMRPLFEDCYTMSFENYPVELERIEHREMRECTGTAR